MNRHEEDIAQNIILRWQDRLEQVLGPVQVYLEPVLE